MPSAATEQILRRTKGATKELTTAGVEAKAYTKAPVTRDLMTVGMFRNRIFIWGGSAELELHTKKERRQAVLNAIEEHRVIKRVVSLGSWRRVRPSQEEIVRRARNGFGISLPSTAKYEVTGVTTSTREMAYTWGEKYDVTTGTATVVATVPRTEVSMLMGWDETSQFVSALPTHASSVDEAHDLLRGDVPKDSRRQGEWFFVPLTAQEITDLAFKFLNGLDSNGGVPYRHRDRRLEPSSSHRAEHLVTLNGARYAKGRIIDIRQGRHAPLLLEDWHRVERNREVVEILAFAQRQRYWD